MRVSIHGMTTVPNVNERRHRNQKDGSSCQWCLWTLFQRLDIAVLIARRCSVGLQVPLNSLAQGSVCV